MQDRFTNFRDVLDQKVKEYSSKFGQESICYFCFNFLVSINLFAKFGDELETTSILDFRKRFKYISNFGFLCRASNFYKG